jgi:hypothetical protein
MMVYPKVSGLGYNEINSNNKHLLRSNTKGYGSKTHYTDSQNSDTTAPCGRELCHLQFSLQAANPETFGYTLVLANISESCFLRPHGVVKNLYYIHCFQKYKMN